MASQTRFGMWLADFWTKQEAEVQKQTSAPVVTELTMPTDLVVTYTPMPSCIDIDVMKLCHHGAMQYKNADRDTSSKLSVGGTAKDCKDATQAELLAALNSQLANPHWAMNITCALGSHKDLQSGTASVGAVERTAAMRIVLACLLMAREVFAPSGVFYQRRCPPTDLTRFPAGVFSLQGVNRQAVIASTAPPPKQGQGTPSALELLQKQVQSLAERLGDEQAKVGMSNPSDYGMRAEQSAKRQRTSADERTYQDAVKSGVLNSYGELEIDSVLSHSSPTRMPAQLELRMLNGQFGFQLSTIKKAVTKQAHGAHNDIEQDSRRLKLDTSHEYDPADHQFLHWPDAQDCLKRFFASWLHRFDSQRQRSQVYMYEEQLRKMQMRWPDRPTAAAEMDYWYRSQAAQGIAKFGSIHVGADSHRMLPDWKLKDEYELRVLGVPSQQTLPFCSWCDSHHLPGGCARRSPPTPSHDNLFRGPKTPVATDLLGAGKDKVKGVCFDWNKGSCDSSSCKFKHVCAVCSENHPVSECKSSGGGPSWEPFPKGGK